MNMTTLGALKRAVRAFPGSQKLQSGCIPSRLSVSKGYNKFQTFSECKKFLGSGELSLTGRRTFHSTRPVLAVTDFKLADIGEGIAEVEIMQWHVSEGDTVSQFDLLCSVQSDKATVEITSRYDGVIHSLGWKEGEMAKVGSTLVQIDVENAPEEKKEKKVADVKLKSEDEENEKEKFDRQERFSKGQRSYSMEPMLTPISSTEDEVVIQEGLINEHESSVPASDKVLTTPAVRRLAKEHSIDLRKIKGSGRDNRILKEDVLSFIKNKADEPKHSPQAPPPSRQAAPLKKMKSEIPTEVTRLEEDVREDVRGINKMMHASMTKSLEIPHFNYMDEYCFDETIKLRKEVNDASNEKMSFLPIIIKAVSLALHQYPALNAHYLSENDEFYLLKKKNHNIGLAMDTPRGLLVPVIKNCEDLSVTEISDELKRIIELGKASKLGEQELSGATFTISNIGSIGGTYMSPVISQPQVAILALGGIVPKVVKKDSEFVESKFINFSFAADHRTIDGASVARFSNLVKSFIEKPSSLLVRLR